MRIAFMGTPEFAVPSLRALVEAGYEVAGVFTQPDRPAGRGKKLSACPVKQYAQENGLKVFQFERLRRPEGVEALRALEPDMVVTAAFGQILSQALLDIPRLGTVNVHASLLPGHRGAAPVNWCIIAGESVSGVTTMLTDAGLDTGDILLKRSTPIGEEETAGELTERLAQLGAQLLIETIRGIEAGSITPVKQDEARASYEPMLKKETGRINFELPAWQIVNLVRGVNPWPGAWTGFMDGQLKIWRARAVEAPRPGLPGEVLLANAKSGLVVACGQGALEVIEMQAPNARRMTARAYLAGKQIDEGTRLGV